MKHTPGYRVINEKYELWAMSSEEISLIKLDEIGAETGDSIITKKFIAYAVIDDILVLCEETAEKKNWFWTFDLKKETLSDYKTLTELLEILVENIDWSPLWVKNFSLVSE